MKTYNYINRLEKEEKMKVKNGYECLKGAVKKFFGSNNSSMEHVMKGREAQMNGMLKELEREDLPEDRRKNLWEGVDRTGDAQDAKDTENKAFLIKCLDRILIFLSFVTITEVAWFHSKDSKNYNE